MSDLDSNVLQERIAGMSVNLSEFKEESRKSFENLQRIIESFKVSNGEQLGKLVTKSNRNEWRVQLLEDRVTNLERNAPDVDAESIDDALGRLEDNDKILKFYPIVERLVFGMVGIVITAVLAGILALLLPGVL